MKKGQVVELLANKLNSHMFLYEEGSDAEITAQRSRSSTSEKQKNEATRLAQDFDQRKTVERAIESLDFVEDLEFIVQSLRDRLDVLLEQETSYFDPLEKSWPSATPGDSSGINTAGRAVLLEQLLVARRRIHWVGERLKKCLDILQSQVSATHTILSCPSNDHLASRVT